MLKSSVQRFHKRLRGTFRQKRQDTDSVLTFLLCGLGCRHANSEVCADLTEVWDDTQVGGNSVRYTSRSCNCHEDISQDDLYKLADVRCGHSDDPDRSSTGCYCNSDLIPTCDVTCSCGNEGGIKYLISASVANILETSDRSTSMSDQYCHGTPLPMDCNGRNQPDNVSLSSASFDESHSFDLSYGCITVNHSPEQDTTYSLDDNLMNAYLDSSLDSLSLLSVSSNLSDDVFYSSDDSHHGFSLAASTPKTQLSRWTSVCYKPFNQSSLSSAWCDLSSHLDESGMDISELYDPQQLLFSSASVGSKVDSDDHVYRDITINSGHSLTEDSDHPNVHTSREQVPTGVLPSSHEAVRLDKETKKTKLTVLALL